MEKIVGIAIIFLILYYHKEQVKKLVTQLWLMALVVNFLINIRN